MADSKPRQGKELERLVEALERALANTGATIESPSRRMLDRDTGRRREHDVLITWDHGHHQIITAIECRDRSRPVGVPDVEAFADKCSRTGVHSGVIVSARGFTASARKKAEARSVTCMDLAEVDKFDWCGTEVFVGFERRFDPVNAIVMFTGEKPTEIAAIFDTDGTLVTDELMSQTVINNVPTTENPEEEVGRITPVGMRMNTKNWTVQDQQGRIWPVDHIIARTQFSTIKTVHPFKAHSYSGGGKRYEIASANAKFGKTVGQLVMLRGEDDTLTVIWNGQNSGDVPTQE